MVTRFNMKTVPSLDFGLSGWEDHSEGLDLSSCFSPGTFALTVIVSDASG